MALEGVSSAKPRVHPSTISPHIPDHELIRIIDSGSYGTVWLARNIMGTYRALKVVYRSTFTDDRPYDREFRGIQRFEPISRSHESQVDILHVGRNDTEGYFYYVMELADPVDGGDLPPLRKQGLPSDEASVSETLQTESIRNYLPRTLKSELAQSALGRLPVAECLEIALSLTKALHHLHLSGLVHRDVKPSNIIFVNGIPKLADIGLVTGVDATMSNVGTEGFAAPEGTGTPQSDIYSLGKVLYEISTGKDRQSYPEPITELGSCPDADQLLELDEIIARACAYDPKQRYPSARAMQEDLLLLRAGHSVKKLHRLQRRLAAATRAVAIAACLLVFVGAGWYYAATKEQQANAARKELEAMQKAEAKARLAAEQALFQSKMNLAHALLQTRTSGQRFRALDLIREAAKHTNSTALRTLAFRAFSLPDAMPWRTIPSFRKGPTRGLAFDPNLRLYATNDPSGGLIVRSVDNDEIVSQLAPPSDLEVSTPKLARWTWSKDDSSVYGLYQGGDFVIWNPRNTQHLVPPMRLLKVHRAASYFDVTADGKGLMSVHPGGTEYHEISTGHRRFFVEGVSGASLFSPRGDRWMLHAEESVRIFDVVHGATMAELPASGGHAITCAIWMADGEHIAVAERPDDKLGDCMVHLWNVTTKQKRNSIRGHLHHISGMTEFSGEILITTSWDASTCFWNSGTGEKLLELQWAGNALQISRDGERLCWRDYQLPRWDVWKCSVAPELRRTQLEQGGWVVDLSPRGLIAGGNEEHGAQFLALIPGSRRIDLPKGTQAARFSGDFNSLYCLGNSKDGKGFWMQIPTPVEAVPVSIFEMSAQRWPLSQYGYDWFRLSEDEQHAVIRHRGGFQLLHLGDPPSIVEPEASGYSDLTISGDGKLVAGTQNKGRQSMILCLWDGKTGKLLHQLPHGVGEASPCLSPDGRWLLARHHNSDGWTVYNTRTGNIHTELASPLKREFTAEFSHDGHMVALSCRDKHIRLVATDSWEELAILPHQALPRNLMFSRDDAQLLFSGETGGVEIWDLRRIREQLRSMNLDFPFVP
ncbi:MAG: protein kinase [Verrucomicrobiales bacterium]|nr:protein kinase [Verrucomicrobiales bacterium]